VSIFDVQHQDRAHRVIQRSLASGRMPHAYLFAGAEGIGRELLAERLARLLLCGARIRRALPEPIAGALPDGHGWDACGRCEDCILTTAGTHPDLHRIYRQLSHQHPDAEVRKRKAQDLSIDVIRHFVIDRVGLRPRQGRAKVFIVREAERLSDQAQNALLKTLEEPPSDTYLILLTTAMDRMLPTTRSRCQQVSFGLLPIDFVASQLRSLRPGAAEEVTSYLARRSGGSIGQALVQFDDGIHAMKLKWGHQLVTLTARPAGFSAHALAAPFLADAKELARCAAQRDPEITDSVATRASLQVLFSILADFYLDGLRRNLGMSASWVNSDQMDVVEYLGTAMSAGVIRKCLAQIAEADANAGRNAAFELVLEGLFIRLAAVVEGRALVLSRRSAG